MGGRSSRPVRPGWLHQGRRRRHSPAGRGRGNRVRATRSVPGLAAVLVLVFSLWAPAAGNTGSEARLEYQDPTNYEFSTGKVEIGDGVAGLRMNPGSGADWSAAFNRPGVLSQPMRAASNDDGDVAVSGFTLDALESMQSFTLLTTAEGDVVPGWPRQSMNVASYAFFVLLSQGVAFDSQGNVLTAASYYKYEKNPPFETSVVVKLIKRNPAGQLLWQIIRENPFDATQALIGADIALDPDDDSVLLCTTGDTDPDPEQEEVDYIVFKYTSAGSPDVLFGGAGYIAWDGGDGSDIATAIDVDDNGNIMVAGSIGANDNDINVVKFDPAGEYVWNQSFDSGEPDWGTDVAVDEDGGIAVLGYNMDLFTPRDIVALKYGPDGNQEWSRVIDYQGGSDYARQIMFQDGGDAVFAAGCADGEGANVCCLYGLNGENGNDLWPPVAYQNQDGDVTGEGITPGPGGDIFVTAAAGGKQGAAGVVLLRYGDDGNLQGGWPRSYGSDIGTAEFGCGLSIHPDKGLIITGIRGGIPHRGQGVTIRTSFEGEPEQDWPLREAGPFYTYPWDLPGPERMGVEYCPSGDVALARTVRSSGGGKWTVLVSMLNPDGTATGEQWPVSFHNPFNDEEYICASDVAVDPEDHGLVVSATVDSNPDPDVDNYDFMVLKFTADGELDTDFNDPLGYVLWDSGDPGDMATCITLDGSGRILVGGYSHNGADNDFTLLKFESDGSPVWDEQIDSGADDYAYGVACHGDQPVIVGNTAVGGGGADVLVGKFSGGGVVLWTKSYDYQSLDDTARSTAVDPGGNVLVACTFERGGGQTDVQGLIKYDANGNLQWGGAATCVNPDGDATGRAVDVMPDGSAYVLGSAMNADGNYDYLLSRYNLDGELLPGWPRRYDTMRMSDEIGEDTAFDSEGNLLMVGTGEGFGGSDIYLYKYDSAGFLLNGWPRRFDGGEGDDHGYGVTTDTQDNIIVVGSVENASGHRSYLVMKYDSDGALLWSDIRTRHSDHDSEAMAVVVGDGGEVFATGYGTNADGVEDLVALKYSSGGQVQFPFPCYQLNGTGNDRGYDIALDSDGNIVLAGEREQEGNLDFALVKKDPDNGVTLFALNKYYDTGSDFDHGRGLVMDSAGGVYLVGYTGMAGEEKGWMARYDDQGEMTQGWPVQFDLGSTRVRPRAVAADSDNNVVVAGSMIGDGGDWDLFMVKFGSGGNLVGAGAWVDDSGFGDDRCGGFSLGPDDRAGFAGDHLTDQTGRDSRVVVHAPEVYSAGAPSVTNKKAIDVQGMALDGFSCQTGADNQGELRFQLSTDGHEFYYHDGNGWTTDAAEMEGLVPGAGIAYRSNTEAEVNAHIGDFKPGSESLFVRVLLIGDGTQAVKIDSLTVSLSETNQPPMGLISINSGASFTSNREVVLGIEVEDDTTSSASIKMKLSNQPDLSGASWEAFQPEKEWSLSGDKGPKTVYARFRDQEGLVSGVYSDEIDYRLFQGASTWYLAEGSTGGDLTGSFETWVLVMNPGDQEAAVNLTYLTPEGEREGPELLLGPGTRDSIFVADTVPGEWSVSTRVESDEPVIAERSVYWNGRQCGHDSVGIPE